MDATSRLASPPAAFAFAVVVLSLSIAVQDNRDPYIDEAMLVSNFIQAPDWRLLEPMPLFEQAAPLGYVLLARLISRWADVGDLVVFRALSATAAVIAAVFIYKAASRMTAGWGASVAAVLALSSPQVLFHATSIKHYTFEYLACSLMIYVSIRVVQQPKIHNYGVFLIACVLSCMFSFTAAIPIGFCLFGIAVHQTYLHFFDGIRLPLSHHGPLLVSVFSAAMIIVGFYVVYTRPVTALQFAAYTDIYASYFLSVDKNVFENLNILKRVVGFSALSYFAPVSLTTAASEIGILNEFRFFHSVGFLFFFRPVSIFCTLSGYFCLRPLSVVLASSSC